MHADRLGEAEQPEGAVYLKQQDHILGRSCTSCAAPSTEGAAAGRQSLVQGLPGSRGEPAISN